MMKKKEILVVDDDIISQNILKATLSQAGYTVFASSSGEEALKIAKENRPDAIILDIMMPGIDGGEVANVLRNKEETKNVPIIFLSSLLSEKEEEFNKKKGLISFLSKPFARDKLLNEIGRYLRRENSPQ
jgi:CheY-like chemotaxis protein